MVLGVRTKTHQTPSSLELDHVVHIVEVKPWPPSQSLRTLRSVVIHWEHSDGSCGFTNQAVPGGDGRIEFSESFGVREGDGCEETKRKKKCIEFSLYEPRWDKGLKGQLLASVVLDLAAYGGGVVVKGEDLSISIPIHCRRTYKNAAQPLLFLKIQRADSLRESVSALMSEEYAEEASLVTDIDHASSHSSPTATSPLLNRKNEQAAASSSSMDLSSDIAWISRRIKSQSLQSSAVKEACKRQSSSSRISEHHKEEEGNVANGKRDAKTRLRSQESMTSCAEGLLMARRTNSPPLNETRENHEKYVENEEVLNVDHHQLDMQKGMALEDGVASSTKESDVVVNCGGGSTRRSHCVTGSISSERKACRTETRRIQQLEHRIKILEGELMEAAALEVSLYSVVAEHGSSMNKVHAPARRLSRLYFKQNTKLGIESASKSIVCGLVSAAKACGNDVPRLTFWLSNAILLRAIISSNYKKKSPSSSSSSAAAAATLTRRGGEKENLVDALEKAQGWIFSRIIESLWWQTFTPHMQSGGILGSNGRKQQGDLSVELWKKAFRDACERICPVRGGGHDCGCLPFLSKLIMEQLVARLDVAMFNAILRESADEIPTDPVADPIPDANVLPIPPGKPSFGAGAQLKNAIGNWSRWLSDLFGDGKKEAASARFSKSFSLLNALSDLMMLPKDMLLTPSIRKEVCPTFGLPLLTRILDSFVPDEFCPDSVPTHLLQALSSQDFEQDSIANLPCEAAPVVYRPPSVATTLRGRSTLNKSQTSDDELDQLDSPPEAVALGLGSSVGATSCVRYQLLRQVWNEQHM